MEQSPTPVPSENSLIEQRRSKLRQLEAKGVFPFKNKFATDSTCDNARSKFDTGEVPEGTRFSVAGRITAHRDMGKSMFIDIARPVRAHPGLTRRRMFWATSSSTFSSTSTSADFIGVTGHAVHAPRPTSRDFHEARQRSPFSPRRCGLPAGQVARAGGHGDSLSPALPRPHGQSRGQGRVPQAQRHRA